MSNRKGLCSTGISESSGHEGWWVWVQKLSSRWGEWAASVFRDSELLHPVAPPLNSLFTWHRWTLTWILWAGGARETRSEETGCRPSWVQTFPCLNCRFVLHFFLVIRTTSVDWTTRAGFTKMKGKLPFLSLSEFQSSLWNTNRTGSYWASSSALPLLLLTSVC